MNKILRIPRTLIALLVLILILISGCVVVGDNKASDEEIAQANVNLAAEYMRQNRLEFALGNLKKALAADPQHVEANSLIALVYSRLDNSSKAQEHFETAVEHVASDSVLYGQVYNNYGAFLCANEKYIDAEEHFLLAAENKLYKTPEAALENAGVCELSRANTKKAASHFEKALEFNPNMPRALLEMAELKFDQQKYSDAQGLLIRFHKNHKLNSQSLWLSVRVEDALGNRTKAKELLTRLKRDFPKSAEMKAAMDAAIVLDQ